MPDHLELPDIGKCFYCDDPATRETRGTLPMYLLPALWAEAPPGTFHRTCHRCGRLELSLTNERMKALSDETNVDSIRAMLESVKAEVQRLIRIG
jgi:hypothetical protein